MHYDAEHDPLCYPGSSVLINKADLRDQHDLDEFEFAMFLSRAEEPLPAGVLDYDHYRSIHRHLFQDVYNWAGEVRTMRIGKGGNWFCYPENLRNHMASTFRTLARHENLVGMDGVKFAAAAANVISEINAGHPFREGNGRTQLAFLKVLALNAGLRFDDDALEPGATLSAMIASFDGDLGPLTSLIGKVLPEICIPLPHHLYYPCRQRLWR